VHLIAKGYKSSDWTRYKNEEESSCACSFRRSGAIEKKNRTKSGKELVNSISIIESVPKLNGGKPASLPSDCNKIAAVHPPPIDTEGATPATKEDNMEAVADIIMHFTKEVWANVHQVHPPTLVTMTAIPVSHWFTGDLVMGGYFRHYAMGLLLIDVHQSDGIGKHS